MAAQLVCRAFGHTLVRFKSECQDAYAVTDTNEGPYSFSWNWFCEFVAEHGSDGSLRGHPLAQRNLHLSGFFQQSDVYIRNRYWLRSLFTRENKDWLNLSTRVCELVAAEPRKVGGAAVHIRLGDFQVSENRSFVLSPTVLLQAIRAANVDCDIQLVAAPPRSAPERMYVALFQDVWAEYVEESELEDHATLRYTKSLFCSNSTFAWTAAFLGSAEKLWMPRIRGFSAEQNLEPLPGATELPEVFVSLRDFQCETHEPAFAGEDLEALCDCVVLTKEKEVYHGGLEHLVPRPKCVFLEDSETWGPLAEAQIVFVYEDLFEAALPQILERLASVKLLVLHNADTEPPAASLRLFLERWPAAHVYAQNNVLKHPRVHSLPMGIQNRMWRQGGLEVGPVPAEKDYLALASDFAPTHPVRADLVRALKEKPFEGLYVSPRCSQQEYFTNLFASVFSFCPPGNAHDTHRLWESLVCGSFPIVQSEPFVERLQESFPSLPLLVVSRFDSVVDYGETLTRFLETKKYRFELPPCLYLKYWTLLFDSYRIIS